MSTEVDLAVAGDDFTSSVSGVVPGKDGLFTADAGVPLGPPALKLIPRQELLSNGELK